eukprot:3250874-Pleurochrysis_carterae.AAC.6
MHVRRAVSARGWIECRYHRSWEGPPRRAGSSHKESLRLAARVVMLICKTDSKVRHASDPCVVSRNEYAGSNCSNGEPYFCPACCEGTENRIALHL